MFELGLPKSSLCSSAYFVCHFRAEAAKELFVCVANWYRTVASTSCTALVRWYLKVAIFELEMANCTVLLACREVAINPYFARGKKSCDLRARAVLTRAERMIFLRALVVISRLRARKHTIWSLKTIA